MFTVPIASSSSSTLVNVSQVSSRRCLSRTACHRSGRPDHSASSKLFKDAAQEEREAAVPSSPKRIRALEDQSRNWDGEESMQDAVLRMLVDKYKPLRSGPIRSADEKLKQAPPHIRTSADIDIPPETTLHNVESLDTSDTGPSELRRYSADTPLLPSVEGHQPWHTTFTVPSHATSSVRYGHIPRSRSRHAPSPLPDDEKTKKLARETKRRTEQAGRLSRARESTLDYRLGLKRGEYMNEHRRPNPVTLKGWASLVEDRIERARLEGHFNSIKGRGKPLAKVQEDKNPFIGREEFLMNRIVQRQGAAPPWVEIQQELESAVGAFRDVLKQSWTRRAIRMLTLSRPSAFLPNLTMADVVSLRDSEWEARERGYHDTAIEELNALVRKYNGLAPYAVRRPYYAREAELGRAYRESGEDILRGLAERARAGERMVSGAEALDEQIDAASAGGSEGSWIPWSGRRMLQYILRTLRLQ